jgi:hypothetical protein
MSAAMRLAGFVGALAVVVQAGCASQMTRPNVTDIRLSLAVAPATGSPTQPVGLDVHVSNVGTTRVWHCDGCGCGNGISVSVLGPDGAEVELQDPNAPRPACPDGHVPLDPRETLGRMFPFSGTLYVSGSRTYPSPTYSAKLGTYTVIAHFGYSTTAPGESIPLERRATFDWQP